MKESEKKKKRESENNFIILLALFHCNIQANIEFLEKKNVVPLIHIILTPQTVQSESNLDMLTCRSSYRSCSTYSVNFTCKHNYK